MIIQLPGATTTYPPYIDKQGGEYRTTKFHWYHRQERSEAELVICPVCDMGPCDPDCPEQAVTMRGGAR